MVFPWLIGFSPQHPYTRIVPKPYAISAFVLARRHGDCNAIVQIGRFLRPGGFT